MRTHARRIPAARRELASRICDSFSVRCRSARALSTLSAGYPEAARCKARSSVMKVPLRGDPVGAPVSFVPACSGFFQELETVAERVVDVHVRVARERLSLDDLVTGAAEPGHDRFQARYQQARMCLPGGSKVAVDAEVNLHGSTLEPDA